LDVSVNIISPHRAVLYTLSRTWAIWTNECDV